MSPYCDDRVFLERKIAIVATFQSMLRVLIA
jgi:hypothetical protein